MLLKHQPHARGEVECIGGAPGSIGRGGALQSGNRGGDGGLVLGGHGCAPHAKTAGNPVWGRRSTRLQDSRR